MKTFLRSGFTLAILATSSGAIAAKAPTTNTNASDKVEPAPLQLLNPSPEYTRVANVLTKLKPVIQEAIAAQAIQQQAMEREIVEIRIIQVLSPENLTSPEGLERSREILRKGRDLETRRRQSSIDHLANLDTKVRDVVPATPEWDAFWTNYNASSAHQRKMLDRMSANQAGVLESIAGIVEFMGTKQGRVGISDDKKNVLFEDEATLAEFNGRLAAFQKLVDEEKAITAEVNSTRSKAKAGMARFGIDPSAE